MRRIILFTVIETVGLALTLALVASLQIHGSATVLVGLIGGSVTTQVAMLGTYVWSGNND